MLSPEGEYRAVHRCKEHTEYNRANYPSSMDTDDTHCMHDVPGNNNDIKCCWCGKIKTVVWEPTPETPHGKYVPKKSFAKLKKQLDDFEALLQNSKLTTDEVADLCDKIDWLQEMLTSKESYDD